MKEGNKLLFIFGMIRLDRKEIYSTFKGPALKICFGENRKKDSMAIKSLTTAIKRISLFVS